MRRTQSAVLAACAALALGVTAAAQQTVQDRTTFVTFSGPVSIPGKTLPAGTYTFRLADTQSDRHIVQIMEKDGGNLIATLLAVPADRNEADGDPVVTFKETPSDHPPAVRYWYYAGERAGNEFVYPKSQAMTIARASGESVMSVDSTSSDVNDWKSDQMSRVNGTDAAATSPAASSTTPDTTASTTSQQPTSTPSTTAPATTATPTTTTPDTTTPQSTTPATTAPDTSRSASTASSDRGRPVGTSGRTASSDLPKTASELPAVGLVGLLALGGALALRFARAV
jgi:hypothetical protein